MVKGVFSAMKLEGDAGTTVVWSHLEALETLLEKVSGSNKSLSFQWANS